MLGRLHRLSVTTNGLEETMPNHNNGDAKNLIQVAFPQQANVVFFTAIILGFVLIGLPTIFRVYFTLNGTQSNLVLCIGAALVLAAFGGQATVRTGSVIMAGVAAVAVGLFIYLQTISDSLFLKGTIYSFDYARYAALDMNQNHRVLGRIVQNDNNLKRSRYEFVLFKEEIDSEIIEVSLTRRDSKTEQLLSVQVGDIEWAFGDHRRLEWELREVADGQEKILTLFERFRKKEIASEKRVGAQRETTNRMVFAWIRPAFAQQVPGAIDVALMLKRLTSDDTVTRRDARDALAKAPIESVPRIMQAFREQFGAYQVKLGICVALTQMLRADKKRAPDIASLLTEEDVIRLIDAAGDLDRTVRVYATEFLFDLGDRRATRLAINRAAATSDDNARYNWLLVAQAAWFTLKDDEKRALADALAQAKQQSGTKTKALFDKLKLP